MGASAKSVIGTGPKIGHDTAERDLSDLLFCHVDEFMAVHRFSSRVSITGSRKCIMEFYR